MYPAPIRSTAHGISAATGKVGSILVVVWLNYLGNRNKFWITWPFALLGAVICWVFVADNTGLDLAEQVQPSCSAALQTTKKIIRFTAHVLLLLLISFRLFLVLVFRGDPVQRINAARHDHVICIRIVQQMWFLHTLRLKCARGLRALGHGMSVCMSHRLARQAT